MVAHGLLQYKQTGSMEWIEKISISYFTARAVWVARLSLNSRSGLKKVEIQRERSCGRRPAFLSALIINYTCLIYKNRFLGVRTAVLSLSERAKKNKDVVVFALVFSRSCTDRY